MAVRFHKFVGYLFATLQALAGLFHVAAYADRSADAPAATARADSRAASPSSATSTRTPSAKKRDAYYRAETKVLGDVARVVGKYKLTPPQRLAVMNYIGHSNRGLKIASFGNSDGVEKFALKNAKTGALLGVIGLRTTKDGAVIVDKATYAALDYKKYVSLPIKGKPDDKLAAKALKGSMELPQLQSSLKKSKRAVALPGLRPIPGLDFKNARQCTARFNADGSGAEYCLVSKPVTKVAGTKTPATATGGKTAPAPAPTPVAPAPVAPAPVAKPAAPAPAPTPARRPAAPAPAPIFHAPQPSPAPVSHGGSRHSNAAATVERVVAGAALVGAVSYFSRPTVDHGGREIESGLSSRYSIDDSLPHYEYRYAEPAQSLPPEKPPTPENVTVVNEETNVYEEQTDVVEENTTIVEQQTDIVEVLPPEAGAPEGTDFTPVVDQPTVDDSDGIPQTGGILPPEEPVQPGIDNPDYNPDEPVFDPHLNFDDEDTGEGVGIPGLPGLYLGGPRDEEPDALKHEMEQNDYDHALDEGTPEAMDTFMKEHPDSEQADYERALESGDPQQMEDFAQKYPDSAETDAADNEIQMGDNEETQTQFNDETAPENDTPQEDTPTY